jgi:uncharacterized SAM-binding protein YcdF (DUF218 family)
MLWHRFTLVLGIVSLAALVLLGLTPVSNYLAVKVGIQADIRPAEAIVVLGAGVNRDGSLTNESMRRFVHGVTLFKAGAAPLLVLLGTGQESVTRAQFARELGVSPNQCILISTANTTREESMLAAQALRPRNVHSILLATESIHMRRARLAFEKAGFRVWPAPSDRQFESAARTVDRLSLAIRIVQESLAIIYYRVAGYI